MPEINIAALVRDLLFASKISAAATTAGRAVRIVRDAGPLATLDGGVLIVDLNNDSFLLPAAQWKKRTDGRVIAFVAHVDQATIDSARAQGIEEVLSNGAFAARLPSLLAGLPPE